MKKKLIVITGQTATGKTKYALQLASKQNGELINADSRQIYRNLSIVTGKDIGKAQFTLWKQKGIFDIGYYALDSTKLWLTDIIHVSEVFSSYDFRICAQDVITHIWNRGKAPILVGGSYLYLHQLIYQNSVRIPPNEILRKQYVDKTVAELQTIMKEKYPDVYELLNESDRNNPYRLLRKLEIGETAPTKLNQFVVDQFFTEVDIEWIGFKHTSQAMATKKIQKRVEERIRCGAIKEVKDLVDQGYGEKTPGLQSLGCTEIISYIRGKLTLEEMKTLWITHERQYAKRQLTFMKKNIKIKWISV